MTGLQTFYLSIKAYRLNQANHLISKYRIEMLQLQHSFSIMI